jgi:hypothetical protein
MRKAASVFEMARKIARGTKTGNLKGNSTLISVLLDARYKCLYSHITYSLVRKL